MPRELGLVRNERFRRRAFGWIRELRRADDRREQRRSREVGDREAIADEVSRRPELGLDAIERRSDLGVPGLDGRRIDVVPAAVKRDEERQHGLCRASARVAHASREDRERRRGIALEDRAQDDGAKRVTELLVEEVLEQERTRRSLSSEG